MLATPAVPDRSPVDPGAGPGRRTASPPDLAELDRLAAAYAAVVDGGARRRRREELITAALPFAGRLARRYRGRGEPLEDLEQVARVGLLKAVDRYDPQRGEFTGYAAITVTGELRRHFRDRTWGVRVPRRLQEMSMQVSRATAELTNELSRTPTTDELAAWTARSEDDIRSARETSAAYSALSLNAPRLADDDDRELADRLGMADPGLDAVEDRLTVASLLCRLPPRERRLLALRFYGGKTQTEIASELGISQMHVSRLLSRALTWLRQAMLSDVPQPWRLGTAGTGEEHLTVATRVVDGVVVIEAAGEIDRDTAGRLRDELNAAVRRPGREIVLSLRGVVLIDAAGIATLLGGLGAARAVGRPLRVRHLQPHVARALRATGLTGLVADAG